MNPRARALDAAEQAVAADPDDAAARYRLAVLLVDEYERTAGPELLARARAHVSRAIDIRPSHAASHALLGYTYDLVEGGAGQALECFRQACRLDRADKASDVYVLTLLVELGRTDDALREITAAAARHEVDIGRLQRDLAAAGMPADARSLLTNGFIHARNFFRSSLADEAERAVVALARGPARRRARADRERCLEDQRQLERRFDASLVPAPLRSLAAWARRHGVGDDHCRPLLLRGLPKAERMRLVREVDAHAGAIHAWLDSFGDGPMPTEATAFMYLALAVEELRT
jgi:tetratricopeptide (TPR) repeat protein